MFFKPKSAPQALSMGEAAGELQRDPQIRLVDVRTREEYRQGHIPGSQNLPLDQIGEIPQLIPDKDARIFVYCLSGGRSQMAAAQMARMGYMNVANIGGITAWRGQLERGVSA